MARTKKGTLGIKGLTYNQLVTALSKGEITEKELRRQYTVYSNLANAQIKRIEKSDVPFYTDKPFFMKSRNIVTTRALLHEIASLNKFTSSKNYTLSGRRATREKTLNTLRERYGISLSGDEYGRFIRFMEWFKNTELAVKYDSDADIVVDVFEATEGASPTQWEKLFSMFEQSSNYRGGIRWSNGLQF